jgi:hypothetical protein
VRSRQWVPERKRQELAGSYAHNWLRDFSALGFAYKPQQKRVFVDTS